MYGSIGKLGLAGVDMATNQAIATARVRDHIDSKFLFYYLLSQRRELDAAGKGATQRNISQSILKPWPVPVPPLEEQRRIVAILEDHLSRLDAAGQLIRDSQLRLARLRDSTFAQAIDCAVKNAERVTTIGGIARVTSGMTPLKGNKAFYDGGTIPWITSGDLRQGTIVEAKQFVTHRALDETSLKVLPVGALLVAMYGEGKTRGTAAELAIAATTNQACAGLVLSDETLRPWVRLVLDANYRALRGLAAGGVQPNLNLSLVKGIEVPLPTSCLRESILVAVAEVEVASARLRQELSAGERRAAALRRSLLAAAFSGQLTGSGQHV